MNTYNYLPATTSEDASLVHSDADQRGATPAEPAAATPHERNCSICRHPNRDAIEEAFLHWQSPNEIAAEYDLPGTSPLYRHAHATGLYARRKRNLRFVLDNLLERVSEVQVVTPGSIIRAVRAYSRITDDGEWIDPPREIIVTHVPGQPERDEVHISAAEAPVPCLPPAGEGSLAALAPRPPQLLELQATEFTSQVATETESSQGAPDKLNANRKSGLLANVANH